MLQLKIQSSPHTECTLHQLSPYIGKLRSCAAAQLIRQYTRPGDVILDPFCGSGTIPFEAVAAGRPVIASDVSTYAKVLTLGKLHPPPSLAAALKRAEELLVESTTAAMPDIPLWVQHFFHPDTLREAVQFAATCQAHEDYFFLSCLLGILHHQRPGFLSYPSSHLVPYLRNQKYPRSLYPELYEYRDLRTRLMAKISRAYKRPVSDAAVFRSSVKKSRFSLCSIDSIVPPPVDCLMTSPPYMNTLDYDRDNRLRLWFTDFRYSPVRSMIRKKHSFEVGMQELAKAAMAKLKPTGHIVLIMGEHAHRKITGHPSAIVTDIFTKVIPDSRLLCTYYDDIPDVRRARRHLTGTKREHILVFRRNQ